MDYAKAFHLVAKISKEAAVPCVLIGGFAVNFYKVTRDTIDVDFLVNKEDCIKIKDALIAAGYTEEFATDVAVRFANKKESLEIDFMMVDKKTIEGIIADGKEVEVVKEKFIIPSINHLIALKLHAIKHNQKKRIWKDLPDIMKLIRANGIDCRKKEFEDLCLKYGTGEIYKTILENCGG